MLMTLSNSNWTVGLSIVSKSMNLGQVVIVDYKIFVADFWSGLSFFFYWWNGSRGSSNEGFLSWPSMIEECIQELFLFFLPNENWLKCQIVTRFRLLVWHLSATITFWRWLVLWLQCSMPVVESFGAWSWTVPHTRYPKSLPVAVFSRLLSPFFPEFLRVWDHLILVGCDENPLYLRVSPSVDFASHFLLRNVGLWVLDLCFIFCLGWNLCSDSCLHLSDIRTRTLWK